MTSHGDVQGVKRQQILHGAEAVFINFGYERASVLRIATEAGISHGTIYNYFEDKSALFANFLSSNSTLTWRICCRISARKTIQA